MKPDKIYIIHYTKLTERYNKISKFLDACKVPYEFITEYDKENLTDEIIEKFYSKNENEFNTKIRSLWDNDIHKYRILNLSEISCAIKHISAIKKISEECKNYGMIIEDDVVFHNNFNLDYFKCMENTPEEWESIFFGEGCGERFQEEIISQNKRINDNVFLIKPPASNCAEAYLLKTETASKISKNIPCHIAFDWEIAYQLHILNSPTYWWYPSLVKQGSKDGTYKSSLNN